MAQKSFIEKALANPRHNHWRARQALWRAPTPCGGELMAQNDITNLFTKACEINAAWYIALALSNL